MGQEECVLMEKRCESELKYHLPHREVNRPRLKQMESNQEVVMEVCYLET